MSYSRTRKPCPACGQVDSYRPAAEICSDCKALIADGKQYREDKIKDAGALTFCKTPSSYLFLEVENDQSYADRHEEPRSRLEKAFDEVISLLLSPIPEGLHSPSEPIDRPFYDGPWVVNPRRVLEGYRRDGWMMCRPKAIPAIYALDEAIRFALVSTAKAERRRGSDIVLSLAAGDMTIDDFNRKSTGKDIRATGSHRDE